MRSRDCRAYDRGPGADGAGRLRRAPAADALIRPAAPAVHRQRDRDARPGDAARRWADYRRRPAARGVGRSGSAGALPAAANITLTREFANATAYWYFSAAGDTCFDGCALTPVVSRRSG